MKLSTSDIKEDGKAGLAYAYNGSKEYVAAKDATTGIKYYCPFCKCEMHITTTKIGRKIFIRYPGKHHTNPICINIEKKRVEHTFQDLDPEKFIRSLCYTSPRKKQEKEDSKHEKTPSSELILKETEAEGRLLPFSSLKQIAESGIELLNDNDKQGSHIMADFIITYRYAEKYFTNPDFKLGARIVYARFFTFNNRNSSLVFSVFTKTISVKFHVVFTSPKAYRQYREKFRGFWHMCGIPIASL